MFLWCWCLKSQCHPYSSCLIRNLGSKSFNKQDCNFLAEIIWLLQSQLMGWCLQKYLSKVPLTSQFLSNKSKKEEVENASWQGMTSKNRDSVNIILLWWALFGVDLDLLPFRWIFLAATRKRIWTIGQRQQNAKSWTCFDLKVQKVQSKALVGNSSKKGTWWCRGSIPIVWTAFTNSFQKWTLSSSFVQKMITVLDGRHGQGNVMFFLFTWILNLMMRRRIWLVNRVGCAILSTLFAQTPSTLWIRFEIWNMLFSLQGETNDSCCVCLWWHQ